MRGISLLCFCVLLSWFAHGQTKQVTSGTDTTTFSRYSGYIRLNALVDLKKSTNKSYYRFWNTGQIVDIWSDDNIIYRGTVLNYIYKIGWKNRRKLISKASAIDTGKAAQVVRQFISDSIKKAPSASLPGCTDGWTFIIEYSTQNIYSSREYQCPELLTTPEGSIINKFYIQLKTKLDLRQEHDQFINKLNFGKYTIGMVVMTKYGGKMKPKGGSSLFR